MRFRIAGAIIEFVISHCHSSVGKKVVVVHHRAAVEDVRIHRALVHIPGVEKDQVVAEFSLQDIGIPANHSAPPISTFAPKKSLSTVRKYPWKSFVPTITSWS